MRHIHWNRVWEPADGSVPLSVERAEIGGRSYFKIRNGVAPYSGSVAIPVVTENGVQFVLMVRQFRPALDRETWELPRGGAESADSGPVETAIRELREETGIVANSGTCLGEIFPDSGLLASRVAVVRVIVNPGARPTFTEPGILEARWFSWEETRHLIADSQVQDSMTLSALFLCGLK